MTVPSSANVYTPGPEMFLVIDSPVSRFVICSTNSPEEICFVMFPSWS